MAANDVSSKTASVYIDNQPAIEAFEQLTKKADAYNKKIDEGVKKAEFLNKAIQKSLDAGGKPERLQKQLANVNATLDKNRQELDKVTASQKALQQQIDSKTGPTLKQQAALVRKLENEYKNLGSNTDAAAKKLKELGEQSKVLTQMKQRLDAVKNAQQESAASGFFNSFFGNLGANLFLQASSAVSSFFGGMTDEAFEAEEAVDSLFNALDNANRTDLFDNLLGEADALAEEFKRLDNDDITGVFTKLIDYGKLTETQIKQLTPVIIDYAAKQKISLAAATDEITRGLEGNARGLKTYGINIKDAGTFAERFSLVVNDLGEKVKGAEANFEKTGRGGIEVFKQQIRNAQEAVGQFFIQLASGPKSADTLFDEAKRQVESYEQSLNSLLPRYDELKAKTTLNKDEQRELQGIINKIVEIVPQAATEFDKYGNALDINKDKVIEFRKENDKFLQSREKDAIKEITALARAAMLQVEGFSRQLDKRTKEVTINSIAGITETVKLSKEELDNLRRNVAQSQTEFLNQVGILEQKYGVTLPAAFQKAKAAFEIARFGGPVPAADNRIVGTNEETPEEKEARERREKEAKEEAKRRAAEAERERKAEAKRKADQLKKDAEDLKKFIEDSTFEISQFDATEKQKEVARAEKTYEEKKKLAHGNKELLLQLEELFAQQIEQINIKYGRLELDRLEKLLEEKKKRLDQYAKDSVAASTEFLKRFEANLAAGQAKQLRDQQAQLELQIRQSNGLKKLSLQKQQLEEEKDLALQNKELTENEKLVIEEKYRQQRLQLELDFWSNIFNQVANFAQSILDIGRLDDQKKTNQENAELARLQKRNDKEKASYQKMLGSKLLSQQEFNRRTKAIDENYRAQEAAAKRKQWERQQKADIQQAIISGAQAILSALRTSPFLLGLVLAGVAAVRTKKQIDVIKSQPVPEFGRGGHLTGPSHKEGGMPVINPRTGRKEAEVEGGEVILSKKTVRNNSAIVGALLQSSLYRNGATIKPLASTRTYKTIDFSGVTKSIQKVRHFENGGVFDSTPSTGTEGQQQPIIVPTMTDQQEALMQAILQQLQTPPKAYVVLSEIEAAGNKLSQIKDDSTFAKQ